MMRVANLLRSRPWSRGEEISHSISHGLGLAAALCAVPALVAEAHRRGEPRTVVTAGVFGFTVLLLYLASTLSHALPRGRSKRAFVVLDNAAVFLLIAGTYTPLSLGPLWGPWGISLFGVIWALAGVGVGLAVLGDQRYWVVSAWLCLGMGWLCLVALGPIARSVPLPGVLLLVAGGLAYTLGLAFWAARGVRYHHLVWHVLVLIGTTCHFLAIAWYVI